MLHQINVRSYLKKINKYNLDFLKKYFLFKDPKDDRRQNRNESWEKLTPSHHRNNYDNLRATPADSKLKGNQCETKNVCMHFCFSIDIIIKLFYLFFNKKKRHAV